MYGYQSARYHHQIFFLEGELGVKVAGTGAAAPCRLAPLLNSSSDGFRVRRLALRGGLFTDANNTRPGDQRIDDGERQSIHHPRAECRRRVDTFLHFRLQLCHRNIKQNVMVQIFNHLTRDMRQHVGLMLRAS